MRNGLPRGAPALRRGLRPGAGAGLPALPSLSAVPAFRKLDAVAVLTARLLPAPQEVYEGMIVGENSRPDDMDVNVCRERKVTNVRQSTGEELERLVPPRLLSLEQALEFCADDECVEVTASAIRLRKTVLDARERFRQRARASRVT